MEVVAGFYLELFAAAISLINCRNADVFFLARNFDELLSKTLQITPVKR